MVHDGVLRDGEVVMGKGRGGFDSVVFHTHFLSRPSLRVE